MTWLPASHVDVTPDMVVMGNETIGMHRVDRREAQLAWDTLRLLALAFQPRPRELWSVPEGLTRAHVPALCEAMPWLAGELEAAAEGSYGYVPDSVVARVVAVFAVGGRVRDHTKLWDAVDLALEREVGEIAYRRRCKRMGLVGA